MFNEQFQQKMVSLKLRAKISDDPRVTALAGIMDSQANRTQEQFNYLLSIMAEIERRAPGLDKIKEVVQNG